MTFAEFRGSLSGAQPPSGLSAALQALWWEGKGNWERAHGCAQDAGSRDGDWVHAYLHRKEGDEGNAGYWYARCGRPHPSGPLEEEWSGIARALLGG
jgi:hypothetical protein